MSLRASRGGSGTPSCSVFSRLFVGERFPQGGAKHGCVFSAGFWTFADPRFWLLSRSRCRGQANLAFSERAAHRKRRRVAQSGTGCTSSPGLRPRASSAAWSANLERFWERLRTRVREPAVGADASAASCNLIFFGATASLTFWFELLPRGLAVLGRPIGRAGRRTVQEG